MVYHMGLAAPQKLDLNKSFACFAKEKEVEYLDADDIDGIVDQIIAIRNGWATKVYAKPKDVESEIVFQYEVKH